MASFLYNSFWEDQALGNLLPGVHTFRMMLVTSSYTVDQDSHAKRSAITNEVTGTGYTAGGNICTVTVSRDNTLNRTIYTLSEVLWPSSTITGRRGIVYRARGGASSADELFACNDFGGNIVTTSPQVFRVAPSTIIVQNTAP
jgi:hypothetical protein